MGFIYGIVDKTEDRIIYVGQTSETIEHRYRRHVNASKNSSCYLHRKLRKYGSDSFEVRQLEECSNEYLNEREIFYISKYETYSKGCNETKGGDGQRGYKQSAETKEKIGNKLKKRWIDPDARALLLEGLKTRPGRKQSEAELANRRKTFINPMLSQETRNKLSDTMKIRYRNGAANPRALHYDIYSEATGREVVISDIKLFCKQNNLGYSGLYRTARTGTLYRGYRILRKYKPEILKS